MKKILLLCALVSVTSCKDYGECLQYHMQPIVTFVWVDKVTVPIVSMVPICDQYEFPEGRP